MKYAVRAAVLVLITLLMLISTIYGVLLIITSGPSPYARRLFVLTVKETSAGGFLADICMSKEEIDEILKINDESLVDESRTDTSLISVPVTTAASPDTEAPSDETLPAEETTETNSAETTEAADNSSDIAVPEITEPEDDGIEVVDIKGATYNGKMMIISDPSRVIVGVPGEFGEDKSGITLRKMVEKYDAVGGTNAGGFYDPNGQGTGGIPEGIVIYEGELSWGEENKSYSIAGLDSEHILHVGTMTGKQALEHNIQYAVSFGPALIIKGTPCNEGRSLGRGINPRTAIGQRADGAILLLVINGRQITSLGATLDDLVEIMTEYGAVNATNLDGGSSSLMVYEGEVINQSSYIFGERVLSTGIIVKK